MEIQLSKYLGKWYEIARIPSEFELDLKDVTAEYTLLDDGNIKVVNSGYSFGKKVSIEGVAKPTDKDNTFKVSFFKGVESDYKILGVFEESTIDCYSAALVGGGSPDYLWILSRYPYMLDLVYKVFLDIAKKEGYNIDKLKIIK